MVRRSRRRPRSTLARLRLRQQCLRLPLLLLLHLHRSGPCAVSGVCVCACVWRIFRHVATCHLQVRATALQYQVFFSRCSPRYRCRSCCCCYRCSLLLVVAVVFAIAGGVADYVVGFGGCVNL